MSLMPSCPVIPPPIALVVARRQTKAIIYFPVPALTRKGASSVGNATHIARVIILLACMNYLGEH